MITLLRAGGPMLRATVCAAMLLMPGACGSVSPADYCQLYKPVYTAASDSEETRAATDGNNAVWLALCSQGGER